MMGEHDRARFIRAMPPARIWRRLCPVATAETVAYPARYYRDLGTTTRVGFISPHSHNFCADCNRSVSAEGRLLLCLAGDWWIYVMYCAPIRVMPSA